MTKHNQPKPLTSIRFAGGLFPDHRATTPAEILEARVSAELTQKELAAKLGVSERTVCRLESGEAKLGVKARATLDGIVQNTNHSWRNE